MGYFNDKAMYGREMARRSMMENGGSTGYDFDNGNAADGKITYGSKKAMKSKNK